MKHTGMTEGLWNMLYQFTETVDLEMVRYYSGRGMWSGDYCFALEVGNLSPAMELIQASGRLLQAEEESLTDKQIRLLRNFTDVRWDSMGLDVIVYWPEISVDRTFLEYVEEGTVH